MNPPSTQPIEQLNPWDQQPGESAKRYAAFSLYCQLGISRSLEKAYILYARLRKLTGRKKDEDRTRQGVPKFWERWAVEGYWQNRSKAYDNYILKTSFKTNSKEHQKGIIKHHHHRLKDADLIRKANRKALLLAYTRLKKVEVLENKIPDFAGDLDEKDLIKLIRSYDFTDLCKAIKDNSKGLSEGNKEESATLLIDKLISIYSLTLEHPNDFDNVVQYPNVESKAN